MEARYFRCRNWHKFQHYSEGSRRLTWIKNWIELDDPSNPFSKLTFAEQGRLQALWRLAAKLDNTIPFDEVFVCRAIGAKRMPLGDLLAAKWIQVGTQEELKRLANAEKRAAKPKKRASKALASRYQNASPEAEQEVEVEKEKDKALLVLGLDEGKIQELDRIIDNVRGASAESLPKLSPLVGALPLGVAIGIRERAVSGGKGVGWVVNALQGELNERRAA
jgi:hypothetical protein